MNDSNRLRRQIYLILIVGAVGVVSGRIANLQQDKLRNQTLYPTHSSNDRSRWATVRALVDHGTYVVGMRATDPKTGRYEDSGIVFEDGWKTVDKVLDPRPASEGDHIQYFYSSKPPLFSTVVAGEYWLLRQLGLSINSEMAWVVRIVLLTFNVLPFAIYLYLLGRLADRYGASDWARLLLVFAAGFGTFVTTFSNTLTNHTVATFLALFGLAAFLRIWAPAEAVPTSAAPSPANEPPAEAPTPEPAAAEPSAAKAPESTPETAEEKAAEAAEPAPPDPAGPEEAGSEPDSAGSEEAGSEPESEAAGQEVFASFRMRPEPAAAQESSESSATLPPVRAAGAGSYFLAGLFSALAATLELPALAFVALAFLLLLVRDRGRTLKFFLPPVLLVAGLYLGINYLAIGEVASVQAMGVDSPWYQYEGSHWREDPAKPKTGIDFAREDKLTYAFHFLIGHHGVFSLTPLFLLSLAGMAMILWRGRRAQDPSLVALAGMTAVLTVVVIGFYIWKTNNYAGNSSGPRWVMWLTPFWLLTLLPAADKLAGCRWGRGLALTLLGVSVLSASYALWNPWQQPWIYQFLVSVAPWMKY